MSKKKIYLIIFLIFSLTILGAVFCYPKYFNQTIDSLNEKFNWSLSHFWEVPFKLGLDLQGGAHLIYEADLSSIEEKDRAQAMEGLRDIIERRVDLFGIQEPLVQVQKDRLIVELAGVKDVSEAIGMIGETPYLEFKEQRLPEETQIILDKQKELEGLDPEQIQQIENWQLAFQDPNFKTTILTGKYLKGAEVVFDSTTSKPAISLQFNDEGSVIFEDLTSKNVGKPLAIYIDQVLISAPIVQEKISGGNAQITGNFTAEEAKEMSRNFNAGALPVPIELISQQTVGPILGTISLQQSLRAGFFGFLAILLFMIVFYRMPGFLASLALLIYAVLVLTLFKAISVTLTLAGIAGVILSVGMAVDANVLAFSRMREEFKLGKSFSRGLEDGFNRAWPSIRDGNFTTILVALILFFLGTSFVKGFALTLIVGNLIGIFSAVFITKIFLKSFEGTRLENWNWLWR
ncbi:protein translocase subunit SecD [Patescibacteria group bacterium]|nr:protein translocase subunit SecD [Patescibacteria group bacterium]